MSDELHGGEDRDAEVHEALQRLARRGSPRGFDAVLAGAAAAAERDVIAAEMVERDGGDSGDLDPIPFVTEEPAPRRRRPLGALIAAAGLAALLVVGTLAVSAVFGNSGSGSKSAEGAVRQLADALSHEDPLAAAQVLAPDEVRSLPGTVESAERKASELQLVQTASAPLAGIDFDVQGLLLSTEPLADGYAKVTVDQGTFTASTHKAQFSALMQKVLSTSHDNSTSADLDQLAADIKLPTFVVAVRTDGKWYVSPAYTVLEYIREYNKLPAADFGSGARMAATLGAATPDAAVQDSMRALQHSDWTKLFSLAPPTELPVYDYRAALGELIRRNREGDTPTPFTISSMTTKSVVDGDTAKVTLDASGTTDSGKWTISGSCFSGFVSDSVSTSDSETSVPASDGFSSESDTTEFECVGVDTYLLRGTTGSDEPGQQTQISVIKHDGRWFVSPVATLLDAVDHEIATLDQRSLYTLLDVPEQLPFDGALRLGKTVTMPASDPGPRVLSFSGKEGEQLLGRSTPSEDSYDSTPLHVRVFRPDGTETYLADGMFDGQPFTLPADGTYKFVVVRQYLSDGKDVTVTVWDAADAPAAAKDNHGQQCTYTENGSSCSGTSSGTVNGSLGVPGETCTSTANGRSCTSETIKNSGQNGGGQIEVPSTFTAETTAPTSVPQTVPLVAPPTSGG